MIYLLALVGLVVVIVLFWKAFGPTGQAPTERVVGPDDDPDFLWKMNRDSRRSGPGTPDPGQQNPTE